MELLQTITLCDINNGITPNDHVLIIPAIIRQCVSRLKSGKGDGDIGFISDHIINGSQRLFNILSLLFNSMLVHGYTLDARAVTINRIKSN